MPICHINQYYATNMKNRVAAARFLFYGFWEKKGWCHAQKDYDFVCAGCAGCGERRR